MMLSDELSDSEWLEELGAIGKTKGWYTPLGDDHASVFVDGSSDALLVTFESRPAIRAFSETGLPLGFDTAQSRGWAHLSLIAMRDTWFRHRKLYRHFDRLVDEEFFESFDQVVFYGAGMGGYAAAAYSVAAPGATVLTVAPQATLAREMTEWDDRFPELRRTDFTRRYGYAPDMIDAANKVFVFYDPNEALDAMHATLFAQENVERIRYRRGGPGAIEADFRDMDILDPLLEKAMQGQLTAEYVFRSLTARRRHLPYLRALMGRLHAQNRPYLEAMLANAVLQTTQNARFKHFYDMAAQKLDADGQRVPGRD